MTDDGKIFENEGAAAEYEAEQNLKKALQEFAEDVFYTGVSRFEIGGLLYENIERLRQIVVKE